MIDFRLQICRKINVQIDVLSRGSNVLKNAEISLVNFNNVP